MRLGISANLRHSTPVEWAEKHKRLGCDAVIFPVDYTAGDKTIQAYADAAKEYDLTIGEVGTWCSPVSEDTSAREAAFTRCIEQLRMADNIGACCCVNVTGAAGPRWDGGYAENFSEAFYARIVDSIQRIVDEAAPKRTYYTIEPMPWMIPTGPEEYERLLKDVGREHFAVHMDMANWMCAHNRYFAQERFMDETFAKLGPYIRSCHIKDVLLGQEFTFQVQELPCGEGAMNLEHYAARINEINMQMPVFIEHLHTEEEYVASMAYVKERLKAFLTR